MELLLLSNSATHGRPFLEHALDALREVLRGVDELVFVPYALSDHDGYTAKIRAALEPLGVSVVGAHTAPLASAAAAFVGGGNTFRLVKTLHERGDLEVIRNRVRGGAPYIGSSAGTNLAGLPAGGRLFRRGAAPQEIAAGSDLSALLGAEARFDVHR
ncbi:Type 1 glutamine amidotransferase-like domain-containing protein [Kribbella sp. WER1]